MTETPATAPPERILTAAHGPAGYEYRRAAVDLLGLLAYAELSAFVRLAAVAPLAPTIADQVALAEIAAAELGHFEKFRDRLVELGAEPLSAMAPFVAALDAFHEETAPSDWYEGLIKAYVGDGISADFYRAIAAHLEPDLRDFVLAVLEDSDRAEFVVNRVGVAIESDPSLGGRLALWGRRLLGEALAQAQRTATERASLRPLLVGNDHAEADLAVVSKIFGQLTDAHARRMTALGLSA